MITRIAGIDVHKRVLMVVVIGRERRLQRVRKELRALGYSDQLQPLTSSALGAPAETFNGAVWSTRVLSWSQT